MTLLCWREITIRLEAGRDHMFRSSTPGPSVLAGVDLFQGLDPKELQRLERVSHRRHYDAGEDIVREGESGIAFFVITKGRVRICVRDQDGQEHELRTMGPGESFGEMALFRDRPRSATVTAVEPTECLALHRLEFLDELRQSPEIAIRLLDTLSQRLADVEHDLHQH